MMGDGRDGIAMCCRQRDGGRRIARVTLLPLWDRVIVTLASMGLVQKRARLIDTRPDRVG